jgi:hypothetical protein
MSVELGNDVSYHVRGVGSISFQVHLGDFSKLSNVFSIPSLNKKLLPIPCMIDVYWRIAFEGQ